MNNRIRISCASLASIKIDNKFLLCLNKSQLDNGLKVYTPFGGAIEYTNPNLFNKLEVNFERETNDLRFNIDMQYYSEFIKWFYSCKDREVSIDRELSEELIDEEKIFESLNVTPNYIATYRDIDKSAHRFFDIYDVHFNKKDRNTILENLKLEDTHLYLADQTEILSGITYSGILIGKNSISIIN